MEPTTEPEPPEAAPGLPGDVAHRWRHTRPPSRLRVFVRGVAAVLVVGFLLGGFLAVLHRGPAALS